MSNTNLNGEPECPPYTAKHAAYRWWHFWSWSKGFHAGWNAKVGYEVHDRLAVELQEGTREIAAERAARVAAETERDALLDRLDDRDAIAESLAAERDLAEQDELWEQLHRDNEYIQEIIVERDAAEAKVRAVEQVLDQAAGDHIGGVTVVRVPLVRRALTVQLAEGNQK